jgi:hypothetical protein
VTAHTVTLSVNESQEGSKAGGMRTDPRIFLPPLSPVWGQGPGYGGLEFLE